MIYYLTHYDRPRVNPSSDIARSVIGDTPVVLLKSTQKAHVLVQRLPQAVDLTGVVRQAADAILASVSQDDVDALDADRMLRSVDHSMMRFLHEVETDITHAGVLVLIDQFDRADALAKNKADRLNLIRSALRRTGRDQTSLGKSTWDVNAWDKVMNTLPLLVTYFSRDWMRTGLGNAHALAYINMAGALTDAPAA